MSDLKKELIEVAAKALSSNGHQLDATDQVENVLAYAASDNDFAQITKSTDNRVIAELKSQIKYVCSLGLSTAKGAKLVYVRTRNLNVGSKDNKSWLKMPDIDTSYHALIHVLVRDGAMSNIVVTHTYENYPIEYSGNINDIPVVKQWSVKPSDRGQYTGCFVVVYLEDKTPQTSFHHFSDIQATHAQFSKSSHTWKAHTQAMTAKSAILEAVRYIPNFSKTIEQVIEHHDNSFDWEAAARGEPISEEQMNELDFLIKESGRTVDMCLSHWSGTAGFELESIQDIPEKIYETCASQLKKLIKKQEEKS